MHVDEWFDYQEKLVRAVLLFIPVVGWVIEILVRISALIKKKCSMNIVGLVVFILLGWAWIPTILDTLFLVIFDRLMFLVKDDED